MVMKTITEDMKRLYQIVSESSSDIKPDAAFAENAAQLSHMHKVLINDGFIYRGTKKTNSGIVHSYKRPAGRSAFIKETGPGKISKPSALAR